MYLPASVALSKRTTDLFRTIKSNTGVPNNVLARFAICLALEDEENIANASQNDSLGQVLDRDLLFGAQVELYELMIREYIVNQNINSPLSSAISSLVEIGAHKMGHVRSLNALVSLSRNFVV